MQEMILSNQFETFGMDNFDFEEKCIYKDDVFDEQIHN